MPIDPKILPLIVDLNEEGFRTTASCEGDTQIILGIPIKKVDVTVPGLQ